MTGLLLTILTRVWQFVLSLIYCKVSTIFFSIPVGSVPKNYLLFILISQSSYRELSVVK